MLYIITPVYNRKEFTKNYLDALHKQSVENFKIVIVDDGSNDGTAEMIEEMFPDVILLKEKGDLWWAEATNIGVKFALQHGADYIMTLNDDTLPEPDYIEKMIYWSNQKPNALLGALALNIKSGKTAYGGEKKSWVFDKSTSLLDALPEAERHGLHEVDFFPGRGLLIPKAVFEAIGFYDSKNFPQTVADLDFTYRAKNSGFEIYCNYDAKIKMYVEESGSVQLVTKKSIKNYYKHLFGRKGGGNLKWYTVCVLKNAPKPWIVPALFVGYAKRLFGYLLK